MTVLIWTTFALYLLALAVALLWPARGRPLLGLGVLVHLGASVVRGLQISFFPLTNKFESFSAAALALAIVTLLTWRPLRSYVVPLLLLTLVALATAASFPMTAGYPPPLMYTIWYPLHVPLSFFSYALWAAAAVAGLCWATTGDEQWLRRIDRLALQGFGLWSAAMICGGIWGVLAWGAYFFWDPKIIWSVVLWFHYATFVHLHLTPSLRGRPWLRPVLAGIGLLWVLVAYVGTSFFFGSSSHAFS